MVKTQCIWLQPRDPVLIGDGRPFTLDPGAVAESLPWPLPGTLAGAVRTHLGNMAGWKWTNGDAEKARTVEVQGPLMLAGKKEQEIIYLAAPRDALLYTDSADKEGILRLSPWSLPDQSGCDLPLSSLRPLKVEQDVKPDTGCDYWSFAETVNWLLGETRRPQATAGKLPTETRTHVAINPVTGTGLEGSLFSTTSICFKDMESAAKTGSAGLPVSMLCRVRSELIPDNFAPNLIHFGGEHRLTAITRRDGLWPEIPSELLDACCESRRIKLQLVTPAIFETGWFPDWLDPDSLTGAPPEVSGLTMRLVSAAVDRRIPVSGWDYEKRQHKALRYAVPAGAVFFFEVDNALSRDTVKALWMSSICRNCQNRLDGYGLAIPGIWKEEH